MRWRLHTPSVVTIGLLAALGCGPCGKKSQASDPDLDAGAPAAAERGEIPAWEHGVRCDGKTDDTAALQAVIDAARQPGGIGRRVVLPAGVCVISRTLVLRGIAGFTLRGQGVLVSDLTWRGDATSPMILLDRAWRATLESFSIHVAAPHRLAVAVRIEHGLGCQVDRGATCRQWASSQHNLRDLVIRSEGEMAIGVHVHLFDRNNDAKNDHHRFERLQVVGYSHAAFVLEGRNAKALTFNGCVCQGRERGRSCVDTTTVPGSGASFWWYGGDAQQHTVADFDIGDRNDTLLISGVHSEKSKRFLRVHDSPAMGERPVVPTIIEAVQFIGPRDSVAPDGEVIQFMSSGPLTIIGCKWGHQRANNPMRFRFEPRTGGGEEEGAFVFIGNFVGTTDQDIFTARSPTVISGNVMRERGTRIRRLDIDPRLAPRVDPRPAPNLDPRPAPKVPGRTR